MTQYKEKGTLSGKHCLARGVMIRCYGYYVKNGLRFNSRLDDFRFVFSFSFF